MIQTLVDQIVIQGRDEINALAHAMRHPQNHDFFPLAMACHHKVWITRPEFTQPMVFNNQITSKTSCLWGILMTIHPSPPQEPLTLNDCCIPLDQPFSFPQYASVPISCLPLSVIIRTLLGICYELEKMPSSPRSDEWIARLRQVHRALSFRSANLLSNQHTGDVLDLAEFRLPPPLTALTNVLFPSQLQQHALSEINLTGTYLLENLITHIDMALFRHDTQAKLKVPLPEPTSYNQTLTKIHQMPLPTLRSLALEYLTPSHDVFLAYYVACQGRIPQVVSKEELALFMHDSCLPDPNSLTKKVLHDPELFDAYVPQLFKEKKPIRYDRIAGLYYDESHKSAKLLDFYLQ